MGISKKWVLIFVIALVVVISVQVGLNTVNDFKSSGELTIPGLNEPVRVVRDEKGMAYIYAENEDDAYLAHGFITAQDRLFNMELLRLVATGRLSEVFGESTKATDIRHRTIGFYRNAQKHANLLDPVDRNRLQKYVDGINSYLETRASTLPLELKLAGIKPSKWEIADSLSLVYYMGWGSSANLKTEIITQLLIEKLGLQKAQELFPVNINPDDPSGRPLSFADLNLKPLSKNTAALASVLQVFEDNQLEIGSNNWATAAHLSTSGKPILANDPHLDARLLPGPFYPIGLITPEFRAVGVGIPGFPGIIIGRTGSIAFGVTNGYGDIQDLYVESLYHRNPEQYMEGSRSFPFQVIEEKLKIKDKTSPEGFREEILKIRLTSRGPIVSGLFNEIKSDSVFSLRWSPFESMGPRMGIFDLLTAKNVMEARDALKDVNAIMLNIVLADNDGNIAWQTVGKVPIRSKGSGTVPHVVTAGANTWKGWIPWDEMPHQVNPERGWVGTSNHTTIDHDYPYYFSSYFSPSWRYRRMKELMQTPGLKSAHDHWSYQRDTKNMMAERIAPLMAEALKTDHRTEKMATILSDWDFYDDAEKVAPTIYQAVMRELILQTVEDELGKELALIMAQSWYFWQERLVLFMEDGDVTWFDDIRTTDAIETMQDIIIRSALIASESLTEQFGSNQDNWRWGNVHQIEFVSALRRDGFGKQLLGGGVYAIPGSGETLHRSHYRIEDPFKAEVTASLRMVADLGDPDKVLAVLPGGVSARLLNPHRTDQINHFINGSKQYWWFSDSAIQKHTKEVLNLTPAPPHQ